MTTDQSSCKMCCGAGIIIVSQKSRPSKGPVESLGIPIRSSCPNCLAREKDAEIENLLQAAIYPTDHQPTPKEVKISGSTGLLADWKALALQNIRYNTTLRAENAKLREAVKQLLTAYERQYTASPPISLAPLYELLTETETNDESTTL